MPSAKVASVITHFEESLEDHRLSKQEKRELKDELQESHFTPHEINLLKSHLFDMASREAKESSDVMNWLDKSVSLLFQLANSNRSDSNRAYFSPGEECRNGIIQFIKNAQQSLDICVFTISDNPISKAIVEAHKRGIAVRIITDDDKRFDHGSDIRFMRETGIPVVHDHSSAHMHHKYAVADNRKVLTGSYNWTRSAAEVNQENIVITDDYKLAQSFLANFNELWNEFGA